MYIAGSRKFATTDTLGIGFLGIIVYGANLVLHNHNLVGFLLVGVGRDADSSFVALNPARVVGGSRSLLVVGNTVLLFDERSKSVLLLNSGVKTILRVLDGSSSALASLTSHFFAGGGGAILLGVVLGHLLDENAGRQAGTLLEGSFALEHGPVIAGTELFGKVEASSVFVVDRSVDSWIRAFVAVLGRLVARGPPVCLGSLLLEQLIDRFHLSYLSQHSRQEETKLHQ